jgi:hypothetical protein
MNALAARRPLHAASATPPRRDRGLRRMRGQGVR